MRFLNENYLRAFPRDEKSAQQIQLPKQIVKDEPGDVLDTSEDSLDTSEDSVAEPKEVKEDGAEGGL